MDFIAIAGAIAVFIGIIAGIVQVLDYIQKQREKKLALRETEVKKPPTQPSRLSPYHLPRSLSLVGREKDIESIQQALKSSAALVVIEGLGGIGKTALAAAVANQLWEAGEFDQVIWVSAKGRSVNLPTLLDEIAIAIDYPYISQLPLHRKTLEIARLLRTIPCLLVLDNFDTINDEAKEELSAFLLALPPASKALVTSRPPLQGEQLIPAGAFIYHLEGLSQEGSLSLMLREGKRLSITAIQPTQNGLLTELYAMTGGNPLAIILSIGQMKQAPYSLETIISNLRKAKDSLFQNIFGRSWTLLGENAKALLRATPLFASSFSKGALAAAQQLPISDFDAAFTQLLQFSLVESNNALTEAELRFEIHPLTKAFAESKLDESGEERIRISLALAKFFLGLAQRYEVRFWEGREVYGPLEIERLNILSMMDWCWDASRFGLFAEIAKAIADFLIVRGHWQLCLTYGEKAANAACTVGDADLQAWTLVHMQGYLYANRREFDAARHVLSEALELYQQTENNPGISETLRNLARVYRKERNFDRARSLYEKCYQIARETGDEKLIALALNEMGKLERDQGRLSQAMELFESAKTEVEAVDNSIYAGILCNMAGVAVALGDLEKAREYSTESLHFFSRIDNKEGIATTKWRLAEIELSQNPELAQTLARDSYEIFSRLGMRQECLELQQVISQSAQVPEGETP